MRESKYEEIIPLLSEQKNVHRETTLLDLPGAVIKNHIFSFFKAVDLACMAQVNKKCKELVYNTKISATDFGTAQEVEKNYGDFLAENQKIANYNSTLQKRQFFNQCMWGHGYVSVGPCPPVFGLLGFLSPLLFGNSALAMGLGFGTGGCCCLLTVCICVKSRKTWKDSQQPERQPLVMHYN